jgi:general secretion pathway protein J
MRAPSSRGFTLIELLVAISILAIVAVLGWRGLDGIVRARIALTAQVEATRGMQLAFAQMQSDAEHMADPALLQQRPFLLADTDRMTLVRNVYRENEASMLQVVSYRVQEGVLQRRESAATRDLVQLDMLWKAAISNADTTPPVALQSGVTGMTVQTWEINRWIMGGQIPGSNPTALNLPPTGLQIALQVKDVQQVMMKSFLLGGL